MPGNSRRRGAIKKSGKGNPTAGSGGRRRRGLEGKGPTPKAKDRPGHPAQRRAKVSQSRQTARDRSRQTAGDDAEWIAGRNAVVEGLRARLPAESVYLAEGVERDDRLSVVFRLAAELQVPITEVPRTELDRLTSQAVHQGVAIKVPPYEYAHPDDLAQAAADTDQPALIVALDGVTDPRNLGAVVRSAAGFGAHGVVVPERRAAGMTVAAWKSSAGAAARLPVARATNLTRQLKAYAESGLMIAGLAADGEVALPDLDLADGPLVLVIGAEGKGLSRLVSETCDVRVAIPMGGPVESLNAGVAAGIALYEVSRRRRSVT